MWTMPGPDPGVGPPGQPWVKQQPGRWEITMSLPSKQQRVLDRIESILRDSDPRLAAMFVIFTRLTRDEEVPRLEERRARLAWVRGWTAWRAGPVRRRAGQPSQRLRAILLFPAALVAMICALLIGAGSPGGQRCGPALKAPATELIVKARQCSRGMMRMRILSH